LASRGAREPAISFDVARIREQFPILGREVHGVPLVYLDSAASSQKPRCVIEAVSHYYENSHANIHRGVYALAEEATALYEGARGQVAKLLNATSPEEIVFVRGTTEAINLVAQACVRPRLSEGDEILISHLEHHSNIVPWQILCEQTGAVLRVAPINERGEVPIDGFEKLLGPRTRMVALAHVSNALGTIVPVEPMIRLAREYGALVLLDGAQAVPHLRIDVQALGCDFYAFSGHKAYGPTGIGALWGRRECLEEMEPYQGGGEMILSVSFEKTVYNKVPHKFEAGTPNIAGTVGLCAAANWLMDLDFDALARHEQALLDHATRRVAEVEGLRVIGTAQRKTGVLSFVFDDVHAHDVGTIVDREGVAVRTGHHCAQPVIDHFGVAATTRASFAAYNTLDEVDRLIAALQRVVEIFRA